MTAHRFVQLATTWAMWAIAGCADAPPQVEYKYYRGDAPVATVKPETIAPTVNPRDVPITGPVITCGTDDLLQVEGIVDNTTEPELPFVFVNIMRGADADMKSVTMGNAIGTCTPAGDGRGRYEAKVNAPLEPGKYTVIVQWGDCYVARSPLVVTAKN